VVLITPYDSILAIAKRKFRVMPIEYMLRHRFESIKYAPALKAPTYVLRAASDDVVPHSHTDQLVAKLARLCGDDIVPGSDHMNIPYLEGTQSRIANFLTSQFSKAPEPAALDAVDAIDGAAPLIPAGAIPAPAIAAAIEPAAPVLITSPADPIAVPGLAAASPALAALTLAPSPAELPLTGK
jgi:hypothetical protein